MTAMSQLLLILSLIGPTSDERLIGPTLERSVRFIESVSCKSRSGKGKLEDVEIRVAIPADNSRQAISQLRFSPEPDSLIRDAHGNGFAVFRIKSIIPGESVEVGWSCQARLRAVEHVVEKDALKPLDEVPAPIRDVYLRQADRYGMDDPEVRRAAAALGRRADGALHLAFLINEHLRERLTYRNDGRWESADRVLRNGHGSCSEYNFAFIALARLNGLPARYVGATALRSDEDQYEDTIHHRWTEVYLPGYGWFPVDASRNDGEDGSPVNAWFGKTAARLLVLMKGDGGRDHPLGWGYVAAAEARRVHDARLVRKKRFLWTRTTAPVTSTRRGE